MKALIVDALERLCGILDRLPGCWGCRLGLANKSAELDDRWHTGRWSE